MPKKILLPLAPGFEELEAVTVIDLLRRAGFDVLVAGLSDGAVKGSCGTVLVPDMTLEQALHHTFDMLVLPGGEPGATHLEHDARILEVIRKMNAAGNRLAAVCAAPRVLAAAGVLDHKRATSYTGAIDAARFPHVRQESTAVVTDGNVTTSRGPGTAMDFALELIELLAGKTKRDEVEAKLLRA